MYLYFCHRTDYHKFRWLNHYLTLCQSHKAELKVGFIWGLWCSSNFMFVSKINGRRQWQPTSVLLPGKSHGWRTLVGYSPWGLKESDMTEWLHFHFSLSCIGEGNATHSSVLAWRIPGTGEPGGLPSMGSHRVGHDWSNLAAAAAELIAIKVQKSQQSPFS